METTPQGGAPQKWPSAMSRKIQVLGFVVAPNNRGIQGNQLSTAIAHGKRMELKSDKWRILSPALLRTKLKMKGISSPSCGESPCGATVFCEFELLLLVNEQTNLTTPSFFCGFRSMFRGPGIRSSAFSWSPSYSPEFRPSFSISNEPPKGIFSETGLSNTKKNTHCNPKPNGWIPNHVPR